MSDLKSLHKDAIPTALEKAERYRLLNEPGEAESICLDILHVDPENQEALITLLLALTDRFEKGYGVSDTQTKELLSRMKSGYDHAYYSGIVAERRAKAKLRQNTPDCRFQAYDLLREAMTWFEKANRFARLGMMTRSCGGIRARESSRGTVLFRENPKSPSNFRWNRGIGFQIVMAPAFLAVWNRL